MTVKSQTRSILFKTIFILLLCTCLFVFQSCGLILMGSLVDDSNETNNESSAPTESKSTNKDTYGLNQVVAVGDFEFTVTQVYDTKSVGSEYLGDTTENNFVVVILKVKNTSNSEKTLTSSNFYYYRDTNKYEAHSSGAYLEDGFWLVKSIGAGLTTSFGILYEIPSNHLETDYLRVSDGLLHVEDIYMK